MHEDERLLEDPEFVESVEQMLNGEGVVIAEKAPIIRLHPAIPYLCEIAAGNKYMERWLPY